MYRPRLRPICENPLPQSLYLPFMRTPAINIGSKTFSSTSKFEFCMARCASLSRVVVKTKRLDRQAGDFRELADAVHGRLRTSHEANCCGFVEPQISLSPPPTGESMQKSCESFFFRSAREPQ